MSVHSYVNISNNDEEVKFMWLKFMKAFEDEDYIDAEQLRIFLSFSSDPRWPKQFKHPALLSVEPSDCEDYCLKVSED